MSKMFEILGPLGLEWCFTKITNSAKLIYEFRKGAKKRREGITRHESPSPRPIKKSSTKRSKHLIIRAIQILKSPLIPFLPNTP